MEQVLVLSNNFEIISFAKWTRAIKLVIKGRAESLKDTDRQVAPGLFVPAVIRLLNGIKSLHGRKVMWKRHSVWVRDLGICGYCGIHVSESAMTIDHILPKSRGGKNTWENTVTCCKKCNSKKDDKTPEEARMQLKIKPFAPTIVEYYARKMKMSGINIDLNEIFGH